MGIAVGEIEDEERNGVGGMAGGFEGLNADLAEGDGCAVVEWSECVLGFGSGSEVDGCVDAVAEFEVAGDEVGVEMGEEDVLDGQRVLLGEGEILCDVALGIDDGGGASLLVSDEIG